MSEEKQPELTLKEKYIGFLEIVLKDDKLFPYPGMAIRGDNNVNVYSFLLSPPELLQKLLEIAEDQEIKEFTTGYDRFRTPEDINSDGIEGNWGSIFTAVYFRRDTMAVEYFCVPYEGNKLGEIVEDPANFWNKQMEKEVMTTLEVTLPKWMLDAKKASGTEETK